MDKSLTTALESHVHGWTTVGFCMKAANGSLIDVCEVIDDVAGTGVVNLCATLYPPTVKGFDCLYLALKNCARPLGFDLSTCRTIKRRSGRERKQICCKRLKQYSGDSIKHKEIHKQFKSYQDRDPFIYVDGMKEPVDVFQTQMGQIENSPP
eukprot:scaffold129259_cov67-Attheya_sp.AAC.1